MKNNYKGLPIGTLTRRSKWVRVSTPDGLEIATYESMSRAARAHGVRVQNVYKTCNGYKTTLNGLVFQFIELNNDAQSI